MFHVKIWTCLILIDITHQLDLCTSKIQLYCSEGDFTEVPTSKAASLVEHSCYDSAKKSVMVIQGWKNNYKGKISTSNIQALLGTGKWNVFLYNWMLTANNLQYISPVFTPVSYTAAVTFALTTEVECLGKALISMRETGKFDLEDLILYCHSLGVHLGCEVGRYCIKKGSTIWHIYGCDSARIPFELSGITLEYGVTVIPTVSTDCATHVSVCYSDYGPFGYGMTGQQQSPAGHWNYFMNPRQFISSYDSGSWVDPDSLNTYQPGCSNHSCNHDMCCLYTNEAMLKGTIQASSADNYTAWVHGSGSDPYRYQSKMTLDQPDESPHGIYCAKTRDSSLYGMGAEGAKP